MAIDGLSLGGTPIERAEGTSLHRHALRSHERLPAHEPRLRAIVSNAASLDDLGQAIAMQGARPGFCAE